MTAHCSIASVFPINRWKASIHYRTAGTADVVRAIVSEIADLHEIIELGPHWDTIEKIEIVRINHSTSATLTVEQAEAL